jgi:hypothetical protein
MTKKSVVTSFIIVVGVVVLGGVLMYAEPKEGDRPVTEIIESISPSKIKSVETAYDFGIISMKDGNVKKEFVIKNTEDIAIEVKKIYTSCMCTDAVLKLNNNIYGPYGMLGHGSVPEVNQTLNPNQDAVIEVIFDPNAHGPSGIGVIERVVTLEDSRGGMLNLNIKANVRP